MVFQQESEKKKEAIEKRDFVASSLTST